MVNYTINPLTNRDDIDDDDEQVSTLLDGAAVDAHFSKTGMMSSAVGGVTVVSPGVGVGGVAVGSSPCGSVRSIVASVAEEGSEAGGEGEASEGDAESLQQLGRQKMEGVVIVIEDVEERAKLLRTQGGGGATQTQWQDQKYEHIPYQVRS
jgi:hypothetical protein